MRTTPKLPPIILGDHGFMMLYGSRLSDQEIEDRMVAALSAGILMLSGGDLRLPNLIVRAFARQGRRSAWVKHMDAPLQLHNEMLTFDRAMSTLRHAALHRLGGRVLEDPIIGPFLDSHATAEPLRSPEIDQVSLYRGELHARLEAIKSLAPSVVTVGGDVTDFLLAAGREDLFAGLLDMVEDAAATVGANVFICSYLGVAWPETFGPLVDRPQVAGLMMPANTAGAGMQPDRDAVREFWRRHQKPVLAMHALAIGVLPVAQALRAVLNWPEVTAAVVGASTPANIEALAEINRDLFA